MLTFNLPRNRKFPISSRNEIEGTDGIRYLEHSIKINQVHVGVYAYVHNGGTIHCGEPTRLEKG